ncbi:Thiamine-phosphate synthase [bioreactor metagenome]|uniref:thiamine phosphate synthase n=1 Tax=bioreactor metagenome TaxID=1076179 RepID=A0A644TR07_9ZZZZ|nr:thiamine phosphate synthase [Negativicutes bacterium]
MILRREAIRRFIQADLYGITDATHSRGRATLEIVKMMIEAGIGIIQYREKDKHQGEKLEECRIIRELTRKAGALFIVNDHPDLALMAEADGVHIGQNDYSPNEVRRLIGSEMLLGLSTHAVHEAKRAQQDEAVDYIGVGPLFATNTKRDVCEPVGLEYLDFVVKNIRLPFVAIGGIKTHNIREVAIRGAKTIAVVTEITGAPDISATIGKLREQFKHQ